MRPYAGSVILLLPLKCTCSNSSACHQSRHLHALFSFLCVSDWKTEVPNQFSFKLFMKAWTMLSHRESGETQGGYISYNIFKKFFMTHCAFALLFFHKKYQHLCMSRSSYSVQFKRGKLPITPLNEWRSTFRRTNTQTHTHNLDLHKNAIWDSCRFRLVPRYNQNDRSDKWS